MILMPAGRGAISAAGKGVQLWDLLSEVGTLPVYYVNFNRPASLTMVSSAVSDIANLGTTGGYQGQTTSGERPTLAALNTSRNVGSFAVASSQKMRAYAGLGGTGGIGVSGLTQGAGNFTILGLARIKSGGTAARVFASTTQNHLHGWWNGNHARWFDSNSFLAAGGAETAGTWRVIVCRSTSYVPDMRENGVSVATSGAVFASTPGLWAPPDFALNATWASAPTYESSDCEIFALAAYDVSLSGTMVAKVEGAWAWEAGLQASVLPVGHPFESRAPVIGD